MSYYHILFPSVSFYFLLFPSIPFYSLLFPSISFYFLLFLSISFYFLLAPEQKLCTYYCAKREKKIALSIRFLGREPSLRWLGGGGGRHACFPWGGMHAFPRFDPPPQPDLVSLLKRSMVGRGWAAARIALPPDPPAPPQAGSDADGQYYSKDKQLFWPGGESRWPIYCRLPIYCSYDVQRLSI